MGTLGGHPTTGLLPSPAEIADLRLQHIGGLLNYALGATSGDGVKELLDARTCRGGSSEFARFGMRYSHLPEHKERRRLRLRLTIAAKELYGDSYTEGNLWS